MEIKKVNLILLIFLTCQTAKADNEQDAYKKASEAFLKQTEIDKMVTDYAKRYTPEFVEKYGGWLIPIQQMVVEKQLNYKWTW